MKFLVKHRNEILALIKSLGFEEGEFTFVKKKGRIFTLHSGSNKYFSYIRKKETTLNPKTKQWEEKTHYKTQTDATLEKTVASWNLLLAEYKNWLSRHPCD